MMNRTKAQMLSYLKKSLIDIHILPVYTVHSKVFFSDTENEIQRIIEFSQGKRLIVRSSSIKEDSTVYSNAGKFESILNVSPDVSHIREAVEAVYCSYNTTDDEEILVQPMLLEVTKSGVVFTADMDTFADYYVINFHEGSDSAAVTSGNTSDLQTYVRYKNSNRSTGSQDLDQLLMYCNQIESFLQNPHLDIEFAVDREGIVYILQVRPIAKGNKKESAFKVNLDDSLLRIYKKAEKLSQKHPFLLGDTTYFGVMPDWNPAEILGIRPKKMAISLYKELITDNIWANQRKNYGYRDLTMHPLMLSFCGVPYIDTRITFNSFIPANLNERIAEKLVNFYLHKLESSPKYHDKIEFEIVYSCYYFGLPQKLKELLDYGFNENEIKRIEFSLLELTNNIINPQRGLCKKDIDKISILENSYNKIIASNISLVDKIYWLIEECKEYGTLPFAGVARAGFIAVQFLRSFVEMDIITINEYNAYMNSLDTVNKKMNLNLRKVYQGNETKEEFLKKWGHIRPGTYDILSKRYDEAFNEYFGQNTFLTIDEKSSIFNFTSAIMKKIQIQLEENGLQISAKELLCFIKDAIEGREHLKFTFTKLVSEILKLIHELGIRNGISREDMAYLDISVVKQLYSDLYVGDVRTMFLENIAQNKIQYETALQIKLPSMIVRPEDVYAFKLLGEEPNYITQKSITADVANIEKDANFENKIVFIQAADPGYDFLFSKNIGGLVTQFGGVNSHMAIRCAELGIPAIIGTGEKYYSQWSKCKRLTIDCEKKQVIIIQ